MAIQFEENKVSGSGDYAEIKLPDLPLKESVCFFLAGLEDRRSEQFGDFKVCVGLSLNEKASDMKAFIASGEASSFIPNTQLQNLLDREAMKIGTLYRITKAWDRGQKFDDGKIAKGYGYDVSELKLGAPDISALLNKFNEAAASGSSNAGGSEAPKEASSAKPNL